MSAASSSIRKPRSAAARYGLPVLFTVLGLIGVGAIGFWITLSFGGVSGIELCPQTFERRSFVYYEVPLTGWQVSKVTRIDLTGETEEYLNTSKVIPKKPQGKPTWHIVEAQRGRHRWTGDAGILVNYFDAEDSAGKPLWREWSSANPQLAKMLWPAISQLAADGLYIYVPELIALAERAKDAQDAATFKTRLNHQLAGTYHTAAVRCQQAENHQAAVEYLDQALRYAPDNAEYQNARQQSQAALKASQSKAEAEPAADQAR